MAAELLPGVFLGMCNSRLNSPELTYLTVTIFELCLVGARYSFYMALSVLLSPTYRCSEAAGLLRA